MIEKNGMLNDKSHCDFEPAKKAKYYDAATEKVASEEHKNKLKDPKPIKKISE